MFDNRSDHMEQTRKEIRESADSFRKLEKTDWQAVRDWHVYPVLDTKTGAIKWKIDFFDSNGQYRWVSFEEPPGADGRWYKEEMRRQLKEN